MIQITNKTEKIKATILYEPLEILNEIPPIQAKAIFGGISSKLKIKETSYCVDYQPITYKLLDLAFQTIGTAMDSVSFEFTSLDIINGILTKTHNLNAEVDVTVIDNNGRTKEFSVDRVTPNTVEIDFTRATVTGTWIVLIER